MDSATSGITLVRNYTGKTYDGLDPGTELLAVMGTESLANGTIAYQLADPHCPQYPSWYRVRTHLRT
jgi:hypothetical protein